MIQIIDKFLKTSDKTEMFSISEEIKAKFNSLPSPNEEFRLNTLNLISSSLQIYIDEYDNEFRRNSNAKMIDNLKVLTCL